jgi:acyl transferase domain-containing protein
MKHYEDAVRARDNIHAVIIGSSVNNDGSDKVGYAAPGIRGPANVIAEALAMAEACSDSIGYVEANGAATQMGDAAEIAALANAFARTGNGQGTRSCAVGSVKANIGHLDVAAGVAGFIKTVQALKHRQIPPCLHFEALSPNIQLENGPFHINSAPLTWTAGGSPRRAGVSAFGIGGTNAHIVLEEAPPTPPAGPPAAWSLHLLTLSGHKPEAMEISRARFAQFLDAAAAAPQFSDICATSNVGRAHHRHRIAVLAAGAIAASRLLAGAADAGDARLLRGVAENRPRLRFQMDRLSSQQAERLGACEDAPEPFLQAWRSCAPYLLCDHARATLFAAYYAMAATWRAWKISPDEIGGASIGVLAAQCAFAHRKLDGIDKLLAELAPNDGEPAATPAERDGVAVLHLGDRIAVTGTRLCRHGDDGHHGLSAQFMSGLAKLYVLGCEIDWKAVNSDRPHRRVELPAYPFIRKRYWIDRAAPAAPPLPAPKADARPGHVVRAEVERQLLSWFDDAEPARRKSWTSIT